MIKFMKKMVKWRKMMIKRIQLKYMSYMWECLHIKLLSFHSLPDEYFVCFVDFPGIIQGFPATVRFLVTDPRS